MSACKATYTPWGWADSCTDIGNGIMQATTPSHGGFIVPPEHNATIPLAWRQASFGGLGLRGYYEEDVDWCMVTLTFPQFFNANQKAQALATFEGWIAPKLEGGR